MESKNKKEELEIRKASSYDINFPDNKYLENSDKQRIQKAVTDGGISIGNKTFISEKELNKILYLIFDYPHKHYTFKYFEV